jgi:ClpP class serine protease
MQDVEKIGQGRVWTGIQALENGLVDNIGGLDRAIRYAQRNFTISGEASVEVWPKQKAPFSLLSELSTDTRYLGATLLENYSGRSKDKPYSLDLLSPAGREWLLKTAFDRFDFFPGTMMTIDENDALKIMLQEMSA